MVDLVADECDANGHGQHARPIPRRGHQTPGIGDDLRIAESTESHQRPRGLLAFYRELVQLGFPKRYPLVQFPNPPLLLSLAASVVGWFVTGDAQHYVTAVGTIGIVVWAWQELVDGVNLFRHALGAVMLVSTVISLADRFS